MIQVVVWCTGFSLKHLLSVSCILVCMIYGSEAAEECCEGLRIPTSDCLLDWDSFVTFVANVSWRGIYVLREESDTRPLPSKLSLMWLLLPDLAVRRLGTFANGAGQCIYLNSSFASGACTNVAKLETPGPFSTLTEGDVAGPRSDRFVSSDPEKYVIVNFCFNEELRCNGLCPNSQTIVLVKDQRPDSDSDGYPDGEIILNGIPWCEIEQDLNSCFNLSFVADPANGWREIGWAWQGTECRLEV